VDASVLLSMSGIVRPISRLIAKGGLLLELSAFVVAEVGPLSHYLSVFRVCKYFSGYSLHVCRFSCENLF
jgi:hypothetical protein